MQDKFSDYSVSDFLNEPVFLRWIKEGAKEDNALWQKWIRSDPPNIEQFRTARIELLAMLSADAVHEDVGLKDETWENIRSSIATKKVNLVPLYVKWLVAASLVVAVATTIWLLLSKEERFENLAAAPARITKNDAAPGGNKATLTLSDGSVIVLDSAQNGNLSQQGVTKVIKLDDGKLAYEPSAAKVQQAVQNNTITTPRGGEYQLILADGSKVWLNSASSITFPVAFTGNERNVAVTGEAYFEVAHDANRPFRVKAGNTVVQVLGTHFNVNAYGDDAEIKTTLLQGMVKVITANADLTITPGEQAVTSIDQPGIKMNKDVDLDEVIAWKEGLFNFNDANLKTVMRQLSRWYDVNVIYQGDIPERQFGGEMQRNLNLSQVLLLLQKNNIHFRIEGKNLIVTP